MDEFTREIRLRIDEAAASLQQATEDGDEYLAEVRTGELESLGQLARAHGVVVDLPDQIDLTASAPAAQAC